MKKFKNFMKYNYDKYYVQLPNGETVESTRSECFAPSCNKDQRWYWDNEQHTIAVRLAPTPEGKAIGNFHASNLRAEERYWKKEHGCVWKGEPQCDRDCSYCDTCVWMNTDACMDCDKKCEECTLDNVSRTVSLDLLLDSDYGDDTPAWEPASDDDPYLACEMAAKMEALKSALDELTDDERELWGYLVEGMSEREIAPLFGLKERKSVNKRKAKLFAKLAANEKLRAFYVEE